MILDDTAFLNCTFSEVTFVYNGTATFSLNYSDVSGYQIESDNPAIEAQMDLLYALNALRLPLRVKDTGKPPENITPLSPKH